MSIFALRGLFRTSLSCVRKSCAPTERLVAGSNRRWVLVTTGLLLDFKSDQLFFSTDACFFDPRAVLHSLHAFRIIDYVFPVELTKENSSLLQFLFAFLNLQMLICLFT